MRKWILIAALLTSTSAHAVPNDAVRAYTNYADCEANGGAWIFDEQKCYPVLFGHGVPSAPTTQTFWNCYPPQQNIYTGGTFTTCVDNHGNTTTTNQPPN
jgi:hypothetical protein